jgi:hypothetical protein
MIGARQIVGGAMAIVMFVTTATCWCRAEAARVSPGVADGHCHERHASPPPCHESPSHHGQPCQHCKRTLAMAAGLTKTIGPAFFPAQFVDTVRAQLSKLILNPQNAARGDPPGLGSSFTLLGLHCALMT